MCDKKSYVSIRPYFISCWNDVNDILDFYFHILYGFRNTIYSSLYDANRIFYALFLILDGNRFNCYCDNPICFKSKKSRVNHLVRRVFDKSPSVFHRTSPPHLERQTILNFLLRMLFERS